MNKVEQIWFHFPLNDSGFLLLLQILRTGFFHADPHPGNVAIDGDEALIYYDFGMMGEIKSSTRDMLLDLFYAIYEKDTRKVGSLMILN